MDFISTVCNIRIIWLIWIIATKFNFMDGRTIELSFAQPNRNTRAHGIREREHTTPETKAKKWVLWPRHRIQIKLLAKTHFWTERARVLSFSSSSFVDRENEKAKNTTQPTIENWNCELENWQIICHQNRVTCCYWCCTPNQPESGQIHMRLRRKSQLVGMIRAHK